jgi:fructose/tagatose bisphosphate aldolase
VASLEAARDAKAPVILQISQGGAAYFAGSSLITFQINLQARVFLTPIKLQVLLVLSPERITSAPLLPLMEFL